MLKKPPNEEFFDEKETWPEERLRAFQFRKLKAILRYAYENLPFYRKRWDKAGFNPADIKDFADFTRVPVFKKQDILAAMKEKGEAAIGIESPEPPQPATYSMTSGTLGTSFLYLPGNWVWARGDTSVRAYWWGKLRPGMKMVMAAPGWHGLALVEKHTIERLGAKCVVPWGTFLPRFSPHFLDTIMELKPDYLSIFVPMLYALLGECRRRGLSPRQAFSSVQYIMTMGAALTPPQRERLVADLGVRDVYEIAGNPEGLGAMECSVHRGHHIFLDLCYVEIVDPKTRQPLPPGKRGSVVITFLFPHGSIYIRYDTEDLGEIFPGSCPCGRTWPRMELYDRLANAFVVDNRELVPYDLRACLDEVPELCGLPFAIIRREGNMPFLRLAMTRAFPGPVQGLEERAKALLWEKLRLKAQIEWVEDLPARWKGRPVIEEREWPALRG